MNQVIILRQAQDEWVGQWHPSVPHIAKARPFAYQPAQEGLRVWWQHPMARNSRRIGKPDRAFGRVKSERGLDFQPVGKVTPVSHEKRIIQCSGPCDPHAFDGIPVLPRSGDLDAQCPDCLGHGQWNSEIDLVSQRSKRDVCDRCDGRGWIETGDDMVSSHDIVMTDGGHPQWVTRLDPPDA